MSPLNLMLKHALLGSYVAFSRHDCTDLCSPYSSVMHLVSKPPPSSSLSAVHPLETFTISRSLCKHQTKKVRKLQQESITCFCRKGCRQRGSMQCICNELQGKRHLQRIASKLHLQRTVLPSREHLRLSSRLLLVSACEQLQSSCLPWHLTYP